MVTTTDQSAAPGYQHARTGVEVAESLNRADTALQPGDTIPIEDLGLSDYSSTLISVEDAEGARTALGLGSAALTSATNYASAAQGARADTALQPEDLAFRAEESFILGF